MIGKYGLAGMILVSVCLFTGCTGGNGKTAAETPAPATATATAGAASVQTEAGSTEKKTEAAGSAGAPAETGAAAAPADSSRQSVLADPSAVESGGSLYLLAENTILQYPSAAAGIGKTEGRTLYRAAQGNSIMSFAADWENVYFILGREDGSTSVMRVRPGEEAADLKDFADGSCGFVQVYDGVLYLFGSGDGAAHYVYPVLADGTLGTEQKNSENIYSSLPAGASEIDTFTTTGECRYSLPYCLQKYGKSYLLDADGNLISAAKGTGNFRIVASGAGKFGEEGGSIAALTGRYLIRYETSAEDSSVENWQRIDLETGKKDTFYKGSSYEDILDFDRDGMTVGKTEGSGETKTYAVRRIAYEDGTTAALFSFSPENSTSITDGVFARNSFSLTPYGVLYVRTKGYRDFWFLRPYGHMDSETALGNAVYDSGFAKAGMSVKASEDNIRPQGDPEGLIISVKKQIPAFNGNSEAEKKMNAKMESEITSPCEAAVSRARKDYRAVGTSAGDDMGFPYSFEVRVTGLTFADENYICIGREIYDYTGGAHGGSSDLYDTFDRNSGELLKLADVVANSRQEIKALLLKHLKEKIAAAPNLYFEDAVQEVKKDQKEDYAFSLRQDGIGIEFGNYEIAPYAAGPQTVIIPYDELKLKIKL